MQQIKKKALVFSLLTKNAYLRWFSGVVILLLILILIIWGIYLDRKILNRINGKVWQLPAYVYGRVVGLEPGTVYYKKDIISLLQGTQYRKVSYLTLPGEYKVGNNTIDLIRRPFHFPDKNEKYIYARIIFDHNKLKEIKNLNTDLSFGFFRLDPRLITMFQSPNGEQRLLISRREFPEVLIDTLVQIEDHDFYKHHGVKLYSIARAFIANVCAGHAVQGGSTLTQQLVKNLFLTKKRSIVRKICEIYMAIIMDARYSKEHILELYLNEVYLGQVGEDQIHGFPLASLYYFGRPINELSLDQQAVLVGMVKGASLYNPWLNPKLALKRRNLILQILKNKNYISQKVYNTLASRPLNVQPKGGVITRQPAFMDMVNNELKSKLQDKINNLSGMKIFTTLDPIAQESAEKAVEKVIPLLKKRYRLKDLETAMVVVDRFSGEVRAIIGGSNPQFAGYNRALQARRSIGSLAKPATYLTALSHPHHYRLNSWISNNPIILKLPNNTIWKPMNDNHRYSNKIMLIDALSKSMNIPTVNLGMTLGLNSVINTWIRLGVPKSELYQMPSILLGALNLTPIEVSQVFQSIASGGNRADLSTVRFVISEDEKVIYESIPQSRCVESEQAIYLTLYTMQQVIRNGTASKLGKIYPDTHLAGKTGTTNNLVDSWFVGIDDKEVSTIWVGRDNNQTCKLYGVSGAMKIYRYYLLNHYPVPLTLRPPENIIFMNIDSDGNFLCDKNSRLLPIWVIDKNELCEE